MEVIDKKQKENNYQELQEKISRGSFENKRLKEDITQLKNKTDNLANALRLILEQKRGKPVYILKDKQGNITNKQEDVFFASREK